MKKVKMKHESKFEVLINTLSFIIVLVLASTLVLTSFNSYAKSVEHGNISAAGNSSFLMQSSHAAETKAEHSSSSEHKSVGSSRTGSDHLAQAWFIDTGWWINGWWKITIGLLVFLVMAIFFQTIAKKSLKKEFSLDAKAPQQL